MQNKAKTTNQKGMLSHNDHFFDNNNDGRVPLPTHDRWQRMAYALEQFIRVTASCDPIIQTMCRDNASARHVGDRLHEMMRELMYSEQEGTILRLEKEISQYQKEKRAAAKSGKMTAATEAAIRDLQRALEEEKSSHRQTSEQKQKLRTACERLDKRIVNILADLKSQSNTNNGMRRRSPTSDEQDDFDDDDDEAVSASIRRTYIDRINALENEIRSMTESRRRLEDGQHAQRVELDLKVEENNRLAVQVERLMAQVSTSSAALQQLEGATNEHFAVAKGCEASLQALKKQLGESTAETESLRRELATQRNRVSALTRERDTLHEAKSALQLELQGVAAQLNAPRRTEKDYIQMKNTIEKLQRDAAELDSARRQTVDARERLSDALEREKALKEQLRALQTSFEQESRGRIIAEENARVLGERVAAVNERCDAVRAACSSKEKMWAEATSRVRQLEEDMSRLTRELRDARERVAEYDERRGTSAATTAALTKEMEQAATVRTDLERQLSETVTSLQHTQRTLERAVEEKGALREQIVRLESDLQSAKGKIEYELNLRRSLERLRRDLDRQVVGLELQRFDHAEACLRSGVVAAESDQRVALLWMHHLIAGGVQFHRALQITSKPPLAPSPPPSSQFQLQTYLQQHYQGSHHLQLVHERESLGSASSGVRPFVVAPSTTTAAMAIVATADEEERTTGSRATSSSNSLSPAKLN